MMTMCVWIGIFSCSKFLNKDWKKSISCSSWPGEDCQDQSHALFDRIIEWINQQLSETMTFSVLISMNQCTKKNLIVGSKDIYQ